MGQGRGGGALIAHLAEFSTVSKNYFHLPAAGWGLGKQNFKTLKSQMSHIYPPAPALNLILNFSKKKRKVQFVGSYQVNIAEFVQPEAVGSRGDGGEIVLAEPLIGSFFCTAEPAEDPLVDKPFIAYKLPKEMLLCQL